MFQMLTDLFFLFSICWLYQPKALLPNTFVLSTHRMCTSQLESVWGKENIMYTFRFIRWVVIFHLFVCLMVKLFSHALHVWIIQNWNDLCVLSCFKTHFINIFSRIQCLHFLRDKICLLPLVNWTWSFNIWF